jgi:hypothetical protein
MAALDSLQAASYTSGMKKSAGGLEYKEAKKAYDKAKEEAAAFGYSKEDIDKAAIKGTAKAVADGKKYKKLMEALGDASKTAAMYDSKSTFDPPEGLNDLSSFNHHSPHLSDAVKQHRDQSKAQWTSLTPAERSAIESHLGGGYTAMNKGSNKTTKKLVESGLNKTVLGVDMNLRRNMAQKWLFTSLGIPEAEWIGDKPLSQERLASLVGRTYTETATMSTTKKLGSNICYQNQATQTGMVGLNIRAHKNIHGLDTNLGAGSSEHEAEVTLAPNLTMIIRKVTYTGNESNHGGGPRYMLEVDAIGHLQGGSITVTGKNS